VHGSRPNDGRRRRSGSCPNEGLLRVLREGRWAMVLVRLFAYRIEALFFGVGQEGRLEYGRWHTVLVQILGGRVGVVLVRTEDYYGCCRRSDGSWFLSAKEIQQYCPIHSNLSPWWIRNMNKNFEWPVNVYLCRVSSSASIIFKDHCKMWNAYWIIHLI